MLVSIQVVIIGRETVRHLQITKNWVASLINLQKVYHTLDFFFFSLFLFLLHTITNVDSRSRVELL